MLRTFRFSRMKDVSGVSGCGDVAFGCVFSDGSVALHWEGCHSSINIYKSVQDCLEIHGHGGNTKLIWEDEENKN